MSKLPVFTVISETENRIDYKGIKFLLVEQSRGVYGTGRSIQLYQMDGLKKTHIKEIGWTKTDNYDGELKKDSLLRGIVDLKKCKKAAIDYIDSLL